MWFWKMKMLSNISQGLSSAAFLWTSRLDLAEGLPNYKVLCGVLSVKLGETKEFIVWEKERPRRQRGEDKKGDLGENILDYNLSSQSFLYTALTSL